MFAFRSIITAAAVAASMTLTGVYAARAQAPSVPVKVSVPAGWTSTALGDDGMVIANGDAYVRIVKVPGGAKDEGLVNRVIDQVSKQWMRFKLDSRGRQKLGGSDGIFLMISGVNPNGVEATMRIDAAPFGDDAYMLLMSAPADNFFKLQAAFQKIENTFELSSGGSQPAAGDTTPDRAAPAGLKVVEEPGGGRILFTSFAGVSSGADAFRSGLAKIRGYFDATPKLLSAVTSKDRNLTISVFNAELKGAPVVGLATANYDPAGNSNFAVVFDSQNHLKTSLAPMMSKVHALAESAIDQSRPAAGAPSLDFAKFNTQAAHVALTRSQYPGGIGSVGIAAGYTPHLQGNGTCIALGEDGSYMNLMGFDGICDPRGSLYKSQQALNRLAGPNFRPAPDGRVWIEYDSNPVSAWKKYVTENARLHGTTDSNPQISKEEPIKGMPAGWSGTLITGTMTVKGETFAFTGSLMTSAPPPPVGSWSLSVTLLAAPIANAAKDFPALIAMQKSVRLDVGRLQDNANRFMAQMNEQTAHWLAENKAAGDAARNRSVESSMANARAARDTMDRSTAGFINHILDRSVIRQNPSGAHATVGNDLAAALEHSDPQNVTPVPLSQYVKGVDY